MMKFRVVCVLCGFVAAGAAVLAQENVAKPWEFSLRAGMSATDNRDGLADSKESNVDLFVEPRGDLRWRDGVRTTLDLFLAPQLKWRSNPRDAQEGGGQNETELFGTAGADLVHSFIPRLTGKIGDSFTYNDDPEITDNGVTVRNKANHFVNTASAGLAAYLQPTVLAEITGRATTKRYEDDVLAADQDEDINDGRVTLGYLMGAGVKVYALGGYAMFDNKSTDRDRGSSVVTADIGVEKKFSPDFMADVAAGYQMAEYNDDSLEGQDSANVRGEVSLRGASDTRFRVGALYGFTSPNVRPYSLQKTTGLIGAVEHDILPNRLTVELRAQYTEGAYEAEAADLPGGTDAMTSMGVGATYRMNRNLSFNAGYTFETWDSDLRESFERNVVDVGVQGRL